MIFMRLELMYAEDVTQFCMNLLTNLMPDVDGHHLTKKYRALLKELLIQMDSGRRLHALIAMVI